MTVISHLLWRLSASDNRLAQYDSDVSSTRGTQADYSTRDTTFGTGASAIRAELMSRVRDAKSIGI